MKTRLENFNTNFLMMNSIKQGLMKDYQLIASLEAFNETGSFTESIKKYKENWIESEIEEIRKISTELKQVANAINGVNDVVLRKILELRYIKGLNMKQIEGKMNMARRTLYRYFNKALEEVVR